MANIHVTFMKKLLYI